MISDPRVQHTLALHEGDVRASAAEQLTEDRVEVGANLLEGLQEEPFALRVEFAQRVLERALGISQIGALLAEETQPLGDLLQFGHRLQVDRAELVQAALELFDPGLQRRERALLGQLLFGLEVRQELVVRQAEILLGSTRDLVARQLQAFVR